MARSVVITALMLATCAAYGRGWTDWNYTNGEAGLVQYQQLLSCAVERCSAAGVTFAYVTSNRVSTGYVASGYGYVTNVVGGVTNVARWTNYVEQAAWVHATNRLHDAPPFGFLLYLDLKHRELLSGNYYAPFYAADGDGTYDSYYSGRTYTEALATYGVYCGTGVMYTASSAALPLLTTNGLIGYIATNHAGLLESTNLYAVQPVYDNQDKVLAASMMARRQVTNTVVAGGVTTVSYRIGFSGIPGTWSSARQVYRCPDNNAPLGGIVKLSLPCEGCAVTGDVSVTIWGQTASGQNVTNSVTLTAGAPEAYVSPALRIVYMTSSWTAVESATTAVSLVHLCVEYYYTNMLETVPTTIGGVANAYQMSAAAVRARQVMWDALRWLRITAPSRTTTHGVEAGKISYEGDGACFGLENDGGVAFSAYSTNTSAGTWRGYYREVDCVYGFEDDPTESAGQEIGRASWAWEGRNLGLSTGRVAAIRSYAADVDWYVGWQKKAQTASGRVWEYDGYNHFWYYCLRYINGSEVGDYSFAVLCATNYIATWPTDNSRFWSQVKPETSRVATRRKAAGEDATNYVITLEGALEDISDDNGFTHSWSEGGTPPESGTAYNYAGSLKVVPEFEFIVRECYAILKLDIEGGFNYVLP